MRTCRPTVLTQTGRSRTPPPQRPWPAWTAARGVASLISENSGVAGSTDAGPIDLAGSANGQFLYVETGGAGAVDEFSVNSDGTLTSIGSITGLSGTGIEGIVAS